jgi:hypothetical protein
MEEGVGVKEEGVGIVPVTDPFVGGGGW